MRLRRAGKAKFSGTILACAAAAGTLATAGLGSAPAANASCASFFGIGNSAACSSTITTIAIALGNGATAHAGGLFGAAFAIGTDAQAYIATGPFLGGGGYFNTAIAVGTKSYAQTAGLFSIAVASGDNTGANAGLGSSPFTGTTQIGNITLALRGPGRPLAVSQSDGIGNIAVVLGQDQTAQARGVGNTAFSFFGTGSDAEAFGALSNATNLFTDHTSTASYDASPPNAAVASIAFTILGKTNTVAAGPGPFAVAGSILQTGATVTKVGPGFHINDVVVGGAAAQHKATKAASATAASAATGHKAAAASARHAKN